MSPPTLTVIAGANGCGKSTLTRWARAYFQQDAVLDPDAVAVKLKTASFGESHPIEAGRQVLQSAQDLLRKRTSFSVETTLSGVTYLHMLRHAQELGYRTRLFYIGTMSLNINVERIRARVLKGGHDVPEEDQRRRYPRSLHNLPAALRLADEAVLLDNSTQGGHRVIAMQLSGTQMVFFDPVPGWAEFLREV